MKTIDTMMKTLGDEKLTRTARNSNYSFEYSSEKLVSKMLLFGCIFVGADLIRLNRKKGKMTRINKN